ncbi:MAG: hypothetical protein AABX02_03415 [archaeon]
MRLGFVLQQPFYAGIAILSAILFFLVYVYTQVLGNLENVPIWIANISPIHGVLLIIFVALFGITLAYQVFLYQRPKLCSREKRTQATGVHGIGTLGIFLVAQCPACASLGALFLPIGAITFYTQYAAWLNLLSIGLLVFTLHYLGAFQSK